MGQYGRRLCLVGEGEVGCLDRSQGRSNLAYKTWQEYELLANFLNCLGIFFFVV